MDSIVDRFLVESLQSAYANLPQLVSKISATRNISNSDALNYVLSEFQKLSSFDTLARNVNDWDHNAQIEDLQSELRYLKSYYAQSANATNRLQVYAEELDRTRKLLAKTEKALARAKATRSRDDTGLVAELNEQIESYKIDHDRLQREIQQLRESSAQQAVVHEQNDSIIKQLNQRLSTYDRENETAVVRLREIGKLLNANDADSPRVIETLKEFIANYRNQQQLLQELADLRAYVQKRITESVTDIANLPVATCSNREYLKSSIDLLLLERDRLRELAQNTTDPTLNQQINVASDIAQNASNLLQNQLGSLTETETLRNDVLAELDSTIDEYDRMRERIVDLERQIEDLNNTIEKLNSAVDSTKPRIISITDFLPSNDQSASDESNSYQLTNQKLTDALIELDQVKEAIVVKDSVISSLYGKLTALQAAHMQQSQQLDQGVQVEIAKLLPSSDENETGELTNSLKFALTELSKHLRESDACIITENDALSFITEITKSSSPKRTLNANRNKIEKLTKDNAQLKSKIAELESLLEHDSRLQRIEDQRASLMQKQRVPIDPDVINLAVNTAKESKPESNATLPVWNRNKRQTKKPKRVPILWGRISKNQRPFAKRSAARKITDADIAVELNDKARRDALTRLINAREIKLKRKLSRDEKAELIRSDLRPRTIRRTQRIDSDSDIELAIYHSADKNDDEITTTRDDDGVGDVAIAQIPVLTPNPMDIEPYSVPEDPSFTAHLDSSAESPGVPIDDIEDKDMGFGS